VVETRLGEIDWCDIEANLSADGFALLPQILSARKFREIKKLYENPLLFRNRIIMAKHSFGSGEYQYFADPLPDIVRRLRETAISHFFRSEGEPLGHVRLSDRIGRQPGIRRIVLAREIDKDGLRIPHRHFAIFKRRHFSKWMTGQMF